MVAPEEEEHANNSNQVQRRPVDNSNSMLFMKNVTLIVGNKPNITPSSSLCKTCDNEQSRDGDTPAFEQIVHPFANTT